MNTVDALNPFIEHPADHVSRLDGDAWRFQFANGHGASVVRNPLSYGGEFGLFEVAVLDANSGLDYTTPITGDVLGWLSEEQVRATLRAIAELPAAI